jgi:hypothetical protein
MGLRQSTSGRPGRGLRRLAPICAFAAVALAGAAQAQGMYQWKDAQGRTHLSDQPPASGASATRVTPRAPNVAPADASVRSRAAADRAASKSPDTAAAPAATAGSAPAGGASAPRPGETACQRRQREYQASMACYAPLRNAAGAIAPEAAAKCGPALAEPPPCE